MKILYGVQATGNGHISRARAMIPALRAAGHSVRVVLSGRDPSALWGVDELQPFESRAGLTFVVRNGAVDYWQTARQLRLWQLVSDVFSLDARDVDLVITDYEPITAWYSRLQRIPSIGLGHQYAFRYDIPVAGADIISRLALRYFAPADVSLGLHWHHFNAPILPPIISRLTNPPTKHPTKIIVYLPFDPVDQLLTLFSRFDDHEFYIYGKFEAATNRRNVMLRPFSRHGFIDDLLTSSGVITNCGFELLSEAIHLGKKLATIPVKRQMEQLSNALALQRLNLATVVESMTDEALYRWLRLPCPAPIPYPDVPAAIVAWLTRGDWRDPKPLANQLWRDAPIPALR